MGEEVAYSKKNDSVTVGTEYADKNTNASYVWTEPNLTYVDEIHPLVAEEKAQAAAVVGVAGALAKVLTAALACSCTSMSAYGKYSTEDVISNKSARRYLNV